MSKEQATENSDAACVHEMLIGSGLFRKSS